MLPLDIPERLVDPGHGAHQNGAAPVEACPVQHIPKVLDPHGVGPQQIVLHLLHTGQDGGGLALDHRLAPAGEAAVRLDLDKSPAGTDQICRYICDHHVVIPSFIFSNKLWKLALCVPSLHPHQEDPGGQGSQHGQHGLHHDIRRVVRRAAVVRRHNAGHRPGWQGRDHGADADDLRIHPQ